MICGHICVGREREYQWMEYKEFHEALVSAFHNQAALRQMVQFQLDLNLNAIASGETTSDLAFSLIAWAKAQGQLKKLIIGAYQQNPNNPELKAFYEKYQILNQNPFQHQKGRLENSQLFFGREKEIKRIFELLNINSSVVLIGEEGIGKSSLLWEICQQAEKMLYLPRQPIFLDLNLVRDEKDFYSALCVKIDIPESQGFKLVRNLQDKTILLALDNVGKLSWKGFTRHVRDQLRALSEGSNASFRLVLAASESLDKLFNDSQKSGTSPLPGICQEEYIKPWDNKICRDFISNRLAKNSVRFTEEEISRIIQQSGGHPQKLTQLCYQIYSRYWEDIQ